MCTAFNHYEGLIYLASFYTHSASSTKKAVNKPITLFRHESVIWLKIHRQDTYLYSSEFTYCTEYVHIYMCVPHLL